MAYTKKTTSASTKSASTETKTTEAEVKQEKKPVKKTFKPDDLIPCVSIVPGELFMVGAKSQNLYSWADAGYTLEVEYQDLDYATRVRSTTVMKPYIVVDDEDFLESHKSLNDIYQQIYSVEDLKSVLALNPTRMEKEIKAMPEWAADSLKILVATMIDERKMDSIQKIKILDSIFGTEFMLKLSQN